MGEMLIRDVRLATMRDLEAAAPAPRCEVCSRGLPRGLGRRRCLEHSEYAQAVIRTERRRRARGERRARRAA